jgi:phage shock protein A
MMKETHYTSELREEIRSLESELDCAETEIASLETKVSEFEDLLDEMKYEAEHSSSEDIKEWVKTLLKDFNV